MRRIAIQEMNRKVCSKSTITSMCGHSETLFSTENGSWLLLLLLLQDREIDGLNEQLDEDARCLEHLQLQLLQEKSKRSEVERENAMLHDQISMLMSMLENEGADGPDEP